MQVAKVFISIYGDEREQEIALEGLKSKAKYVRMGLGKRMSLRMTPEVRFVKDESLERGSRVSLLHHGRDKSYSIVDHSIFCDIHHEDMVKFAHLVKFSDASILFGLPR